MGATALLLFHYLRDIRSYPFDATGYWGMAILPWGETAGPAIRGYLFPTLLRGWVWLYYHTGLHPLHAFRSFSALAYAAVLALLVPATMARLAGGRLGTARRLVPLVLVTLAFPGLLLYPLSDLPALAFLWLALWCVLCARDAGKRTHMVLFAIGTGAAGAAAYNTRTVYLFAVAVLALTALWQLRGRRATWLCAAALGFALVSAPQWAINQARHGAGGIDPTATPAQRSLFAQQLTWGISLQRYETTLDPAAPSPTVRYIDPAGRALLARICGANPLRTVADYGAAVLAYPLDFLALYGRHLVNGLDLRDGEVYTTGPSTGKMLMSAASALLLAVLALGLATSGAEGAALRAPARDMPYALALALPSLAAIPGAMETRFMLPLLLAVAAAAAVLADPAAMAAALRRRWPLLLPLAIAGCALFVAVTQATMAGIEPAGAPPLPLDCPSHSLNIQPS